MFECVATPICSTINLNTLEALHNIVIQESGRVAPCTLNLGNTHRQVVTLTLRALYCQEKLVGKYGGSLGLFGQFGKEENFLLMLQIEPKFLSSFFIIMLVA